MSTVDLAKYCVNAVLVEWRSVRAVAQATGTSKSWVHRHVQLYRAGGEIALMPLAVDRSVDCQSLTTSVHHNCLHLCFNL